MLGRISSRSNTSQKPLSQGQQAAGEWQREAGRFSVCSPQEESVLRREAQVGQAREPVAQLAARPAADQEHAVGRVGRERLRGEESLFVRAGAVHCRTEHLGRSTRVCVCGGAGQLKMNNQAAHENEQHATTSSMPQPRAHLKNGQHLWRRLGG